MWEETENLLVLGQFLLLGKKKSVLVFTQISLVWGLEEVSWKPEPALPTLAHLLFTWQQMQLLRLGERSHLQHRAQSRCARERSN